MFISNTYSAVGATYVSKTHSANAVESVQTTQSNNIHNGADSVTLSDADRQAAYAEKEVSGKQSNTSGSYPLEMYQMPSWHAEHMFQVPGQLL